LIHIKHLAFLSIACGIFSSSMAWADDCDNAANDTEVHQCLVNKKDNAEKVLNAEYAKAKDRIKQGLRDSPSDTQAYLDLFVKAQRSWLDLRKYQCEMEAFGADKSKNPYLDAINDCTAKMDNERTRILMQIPYDGLNG
jgi:uncharacterized protein YecT (DUF1311 family)